MLITLYTFPYPPNTIGPFNGQGLRQPHSSVGVIRDLMGVEVPQFYTNGAGLVSEQGLDPRLRNLLMRCLAVIPSHRPGLEELEAWALQAETNPGFFGGIGGDLYSTDLADQFICRPREVRVFPNPTLSKSLANQELRHDSPHRPRYKWPSRLCPSRRQWRCLATRNERPPRICGDSYLLFQLPSRVVWEVMA